MSVTFVWAQFFLAILFIVWLMDLFAIILGLYVYIPEIKTKNVSESFSNMGASISLQPNDGKKHLSTQINIYFSTQSLLIHW